MNIVLALLSVLFGAYFLYMGVQGLWRGTITSGVHTYTGCMANIISGIFLIIGLFSLVVALNFFQSPD